LEPWNFIDFPFGNFIIPTDELIFFRGAGIPPTRFIVGNPIPIIKLPFGDGLLLGYHMIKEPSKVAPRDLLSQGAKWCGDSIMYM